MNEQKEAWRDIINLAFKVVVGLLVPWAVWMTKNSIECRQFMNRGDRFTAKDAYMMQREFDARMDALPPPDWRARVKNIEQQTEIYRQEIRKLENEWTRDFMRKDEHQQNHQ